jgi:hypothetical protein
LAEIPQIVQEFIQNYIESVDALEILLLLRDVPQKEWGSLAVSRALGFDPNAVATRLDKLKSAGLIRDRTVANERLYRYGPSTPEMALALNELAKLYPTYRVRIIGIIFSKPLNGIRTYADSFRSRHNEEDK